MAQLLRTPLAQRIVIGVIALGLIALGAGTLVNDALNYRNAWGGMVFAPFTILIGGTALAIVVFAPKKLLEPPNKRKKRMRLRRRA